MHMLPLYSKMLSRLSSHCNHRQSGSTALLAQLMVQGRFALDVQEACVASDMC